MSLNYWYHWLTRITLLVLVLMTINLWLLIKWLSIKPVSGHTRPLLGWAWYDIPTECVCLSVVTAELVFPLFVSSSPFVWDHWHGARQRCLLFQFRVFRVHMYWLQTSQTQLDNINILHINQKKKKLHQDRRKGTKLLRFFL